MLLVTLVFYLIPSLSRNGDEAAGFMVMVVLPLMLWCDYKQLFGYGWWGTLWRIVASVFLAITVVKLLVYISGTFYGMIARDGSLSVRYVLAFANHLALLWVALEAVMLVNTKPWREGVAWPRMLWRQLVAAAALSLTTVVCEQLGIESSMSNIIKSMQTMFLPE